MSLPVVIPWPAAHRVGAALAFALLLGACDAPTTNVRFRLGVPLHSNVSSVAATIENGPRSVTFDRADFVDAPGWVEATRFVGVDPRREVRVSVELRADQTVFATGGFAFRPQQGWGYDVVFAITDTDPTTFCFGCGNAFSFPLAPGFGAPGESLWMFLTFDPRDDDVVF